ncbi:MAG TPA: HEAT repeat domain-containing protein [Chthonomonadaceae bacterium]|nr:HEAT repeat domain-containing protein [Chthonomonadaceae bacterium]
MRETAALDVLRKWDPHLQALWSGSQGAGQQIAIGLYAPDMREAAEALPNTAERLAQGFWRTLNMWKPRPPESPEGRYEAVVAVVWRVLWMVRKAPPQRPFVEEVLAAALRPVRRLRAGLLTPEVCALLYDYYRGVWAAHLTRPQLQTIRDALACTLAALPPDEMDAFWEKLQSPKEMMRAAMRLGLEDLRDAHAVPHLLRGLEQSQDTAVRHSIVDCLEQIADPRAIAALIRLRRETALPDWMLARRIARAIRVIEQQNRGGQHRLLLRPAEEAPDLLRPVADPPDDGKRDLLRPLE